MTMDNRTQYYIKFCVYKIEKDEHKFPVYAQCDFPPVVSSQKLKPAGKQLYQSFSLVLKFCICIKSLICIANHEQQSDAVRRWNLILSEVYLICI